MAKQSGGSIGGGGAVGGSSPIGGSAGGGGGARKANSGAVSGQLNNPSVQAAVTMQVAGGIFGTVGSTGVGKGKGTGKSSVVSKK